MPDRPRRPGTNADHDRFARKDSPALGVPVSFEGPATGVLEGDELLAARARRSVEERLARLEQRADDHDKRDDEIATALGHIGDELADVGKGLAAVAAVVQDRGRPKSPSGERPSIESAVEAQLAKQQVAEIRERRDHRRKIVLALVSGLSSGVVIVWLLQHFLGGH